MGKDKQVENETRWKIILAKARNIIYIEDNKRQIVGAVKPLEWRNIMEHTDLVGIEIRPQQDNIEVTITMSDGTSKTFDISSLSKGIEFWQDGGLWKKIENGKIDNI